MKQRYWSNLSVNPTYYSSNILNSLFTINLDLSAFALAHEVQCKDPLNNNGTDSGSKDCKVRSVLCYA